MALEERLGALAGKAQQKIASEYGSFMTKTATLVAWPSRVTSASPKSTWALPARWASGTNTSAWPRRQARTASLTVVWPPV